MLGLIPLPEVSAPHLRQRSARPFLLSLLGLGVLCWLAFFNRLGALGLMDKTEALFVEVGHQMWLRQDWITPWWNGEHFFDYPVWGYWMVALSFQLLGVSPWAARLPVALAASTVVLAVFLLLVHWGHPQEQLQHKLGRGAVAASVLATSPGWIGWGRTSTTDMFLSSAISLALLAFLLAHHEDRRSPWATLGRMGFPLFCGVAVLAKGPVGLLLPLLIVGAFLVLTGEWNQWLKPWRLLAMGALFLGITLPWYAAAAQVHGAAFLGAFLGFSNLQRFTQVIYDHPGPPWFYLPWLVILLFPWSLFLPGACLQLRFWRWDRWHLPQERSSLQSHVGLFLLLWLLIPLVFFSIAATKLPGYILPVLPAGALLVSLSFWPLPEASARAADRPPAALPRPFRWSAGVEVVLLLAMAVASAMAPRWAASDPAHPTFAAVLERSGLPMLLSAILVLTALALGMVLLGGRDRRWVWGANLAGFLTILALVVSPLAPLLDQERLLPIRLLASEAKALALPDEPLWVVGTKRYSVLFYGRDRAAFVSGKESLADRLDGDRPSLGLSRTSQTAQIFGDRRHLERLDWPPDQVQRLAKVGEQELWRVRLPTPNGGGPR